VLYFGRELDDAMLALSERRLDALTCRVPFAHGALARRDLVLGTHEVALSGGPQVVRLG
jgi:hypothetical protein